jgi:uncharacterized protein YbjT (DUF2867 family)
MKVAVIGAHGKVARLLLPVLVDRDVEVRGLVRKDEQAPFVRQVGGEPVLLDVEHASTEEIAEALRGADAVVWSAGAGGGNPDRTYAVDRDAAIRSMDAARAAGVDRYVMVSWIGSVPEHGIPEDAAFYPYADAKIAADDHLRGTELAWTVLGPGTLTLEPGRGSVNPGARFDDGDVTSRELVAQVAVAVLADDRAARRTLVFGDGDVPIDEWLGSLPPTE